MPPGGDGRIGGDRQPGPVHQPAFSVPVERSNQRFSASRPTNVTSPFAAIQSRARNSPTSPPGSVGLASSRPATSSSVPGRTFQRPESRALSARPCSSLGTSSGCGPAPGSALAAVSGSKSRACAARRASGSLSWSLIHRPVKSASSLKRSPPISTCRAISSRSTLFTARSTDRPSSAAIARTLSSKLSSSPPLITTSSHPRRAASLRRRGNRIGSAAPGRIATSRGCQAAL